MDRSERQSKSSSELKPSGEPSDSSDSSDSSDPNDLDPFEINFLPQFLEGRGPRQPFVNSHGVLIGDHDYQSAQSPLEQWSTDIDPASMAGDEWVHPFKDIGFHSAENRDLFEKGIVPQNSIMMHPDKDVAYQVYNNETDDRSSEESGNEQ